MSGDGRISWTDGPRGRRLAGSGGRPAGGAERPGGLAPRTRATASDLTASGQGFDILRPLGGSLNFPGVFQAAGCQASKNTGSAHSAGA